MPLTRLTSWNDDETPTAAELNAEFNQIYAKFSAGITAGDISDEILQADSTAVNAASYDTIQEAINDAATNSKNVILPPGTYNADTQPIEVPANVRLIGAGASLVTIVPASGYVHSQFIKLVGANSGIENVKLQMSNLGPSNYIFSLVTIESTDATDIQIRNCEFELLAVNNGTIARAIEISAGSSARELLEIKSCYFDGSAVVNSASITGIQINTSYRMVIKNCRFEDVGEYSIRCDSARHLHIHHNQWSTTSESRGDLVKLQGDFIFEDNYFNSYRDFTEQYRGSYLDATSYLDSRGIIRNNIFVYSGIATYHPGYAMYVRGNIVAQDNRGGAGTTGFDYGFIYYNMLSNDYTYMQRNTVNAGQVYYAPRGGFRTQLYGKTFGDANLMSIGDVIVWLHYNTTASQTYIHFSQQFPSDSTDYQARLELDGSVDLTD